MTDTVKAPETGDIVLDVHNCANRHGYRVTFEEGPGVEERALAWINERGMTHAIFEVEESPIPTCYGKLLDLLYPTCSHGMSLWLCEGPNHYAPDL